MNFQLFFSISNCGYYASSRVGCESACFCFALLLLLCFLPLHCCFAFWFWCFMGYIGYILYALCFMQCKLLAGLRKSQKIRRPRWTNRHTAPVISIGALAFRVAIVLASAIFFFMLLFFFSPPIGGWVDGLNGGVAWPPTRRRAIKTNLLTVTHKSGRTKRHKATKQARRQNKQKQKPKPKAEQQKNKDSNDNIEEKSPENVRHFYDIIESL